MGGLNFNPKKNSDPAAARPALVLSARLAPGIAVSLASLRGALGSACFGDGMLTTKRAADFAEGFNLPLSEHGRVTEAAGRRSLLLMATVDGS